MSYGSINSYYQLDKLICLNFWDEAWLLLLIRIFWLLSSSLLFYLQRFDQYVLRPSSSISCRTLEPTQTLDLNTLFEPQG